LYACRTSSQQRNSDHLQKTFPCNAIVVALKRAVWLRAGRDAPMLARLRLLHGCRLLGLGGRRRLLRLGRRRSLLGRGGLGLLGGRRGLLGGGWLGDLDLLGRSGLLRLVRLRLGSRRRLGSGLFGSRRLLRSRRFLWRLGASSRLRLGRLLGLGRRSLGGLLGLGGGLGLLRLLADAEASGSTGSLGLLQAVVLDAGAQRDLEVRVDDVLVAADLEVLHDVLEDGLARRAAALLERRQRLVHHLAVLGMIDGLLGRLAGGSGSLLLRAALDSGLDLGGDSLGCRCGSCVRHSLAMSSLDGRTANRRLRFVD